jgi:hypothetical protein
LVDVSDKVSEDRRGTTDDQDGPNPVEQLLELLLYAPIGLLYEYPEVLPKLIKRGKSQVQLAKVFGQLAMNQRQEDHAGPVGDITSVASSVVARIITDIGAQIGLAPPSASPSKPASWPDRGEPEPSDPSPSADGADPDGSDAVEEVEADGGERSLPIAGYDSLTARELIPLLDELSGEQRARVRTYETSHRNRKTVLAKLDRLEV